MKINRLNIGEEVRKKVEESGLSKAKFAELLGIARQNIEKTVFQKHSLDTDLLCNISEVLNCNFSITINRIVYVITVITRCKKKLRQHCL